MRISEYISAMQRIQDTQGDLEVEISGYSGRQSAAPPRVAYRKVLSKRESRPEFGTYGAPNCGDKVCKIG